MILSPKLMRALSALGREGGHLTDKQKTQIKAFTSEVIAGL